MVYGFSDDLIEVKGDIREEFYGVDRRFLAFSDGTILHIVYNDEGIWRITPVFKGTSEVSIRQAISSDDEEYSDVATLTGDFKWVVAAKEMALRTK